MKHLFIKLLFAALLILPSLAKAQQNDIRIKNFNLDDGVAIEGYDPVSYLTGKPLEGKREHTFIHKGITYRFATATNRSAFSAQPDKYEPAYGGWCAYAMGESGEKVRIDPETYKVIEGKVYLFYNFWGNNTVKDWNQDESRLKSSADRQWKKYVSP
jgi:hypothetical protein